CRHLHWRDDRQASRPRGRLTAHRLRHLRGEHGGGAPPPRRGGGGPPPRGGAAGPPPPPPRRGGAPRRRARPTGPRLLRRRGRGRGRFFWCRVGGAPRGGPPHAAQARGLHAAGPRLSRRHVLSDPITLDDVRAAQARLKGLVAATPCPYSETLSRLTGTRVFVKLENLQMTGSFKERGATNELLLLCDAVRRRGVVAARAGN